MVGRAMADVAANRNMRAAAVRAVVELAEPATRVLKYEASLVAGQIVAPAAQAYEVPAASPPVSPHGAG